MKLKTQGTLAVVYVSETRPPHTKGRKCAEAVREQGGEGDMCT